MNKIIAIVLTSALVAAASPSFAKPSSVATQTHTQTQGDVL